MKIDIEIGKDTCQFILHRYGYVSEKVTLYYDPMADVRGIDDAPANELIGVEKTVAYPNGERPEVLSEAHPLVEDCEDLMYDDVVKSLFNSWLLKTMFMHEPI